MIRITGKKYTAIIKLLFPLYFRSKLVRLVRRPPPTVFGSYAEKWSPEKLPPEKWSPGKMALEKKGPREKWSPKKW